MIEDFVADFKNMKKANYHEAQITLTEAVLVPFLSLTWNMFLFARTFWTLFQLSENLKEIQWYLPIADIPNSGHVLSSGQNA